MPRILARSVSTLAIAGLAVTMATSASAQTYTGGYRQTQPYYDPAYAQQAPQGYDGRELPPPPPGWSQPSDWTAQQAANQRYADAAQGWANSNCVRSQSNTGVGAVIGGVLGAVIGRSIAGRHDRTAGTIAGAVVGAAGGAAIGSTTGGRTSPGCPPGYVLRQGASPYDYSASGYTYAAPSWYKPWISSGSTWYYRPYPYGRYYYHAYVARDSYSQYGNGQYGNQRPGYGRPSGWYDSRGRYHQNDGSWYDQNGVFHMGPRR